MNEHDDHILQIATDRFERRLSEEAGKLRVEIAGVRGEVAGVRGEIAGLRGEMMGLRGDLRTEIIARNHELLKWGLVFWLMLVAMIGGLLVYR